MLKSFFNKLIKDSNFKTKTLLLTSLVFNGSYSIFLFIASILAFSKWFFAMAIYYALLFLARIVLFIQINKNVSLRVKILTVRTCGYFLLTINFAISTVMFILIYSNNFAKQHEITVITIATYTFYLLTVAIIGCVKYFRQNNHLYSCIKVISLTSASVSLATLTNTMLLTFGEQNELLRSVILPILCVFITILIVVGAIILIRKANLDLRVLNNEKERK
ncbi:MAG: hypothetical protein J6R29_05180 [Clostridia bacterium]|nr:hypothetical protein [Clostridia bacterium]